MYSGAFLNKKMEVEGGKERQDRICLSRVWI